MGALVGPLVITALLVVPLMALGASATRSLPPPASALTSHASISIVGDANFTAGNGVVSGSGTPADPFIIAGWDLDVNRSNGIGVRNTTASFIIRDSFLHGGNYSFAAVRLENVSHALVTNVSILETAQFAVLVVNSTYVTVSRNSVTGYNPISFYGSSDSGAYNNTVTPSNLGIGIVFSGSGRITVAGNRVSLGGRGIEGDSSNASSIRDNVIAGAYLSSIHLWDSVNVSLRGNAMTGFGSRGPTGIELNGWQTGYAWAEGKTITSDNTVGGLPVLYYTGCRNTTIDHVEPGQLILAGCVGVTVTNITLGSPGWSFHGILSILNSWNWTFTRNTFYGLNIEHDGVHGSQDGSFYLNNVFGLGLNGAPLTAALTAPYPVGGNYWGGYTGQDVCSGPAQNVCPDPDGFGDTPATTMAGTDSLPWMKPLSLTNTPPNAAAAAAPAQGFPSTTFVFNASGSTDAQDSSSALQVRWDWNDDGRWDTNWSFDKVASHSFGAPGTYTVGLEVRDSQGWLALGSVQVTVAPTPFVEVLAANWPALAIAAALVVTAVYVLWRARSRRVRTRGPPGEPGSPP